MIINGVVEYWQLKFVMAGKAPDAQNQIVAGFISVDESTRLQLEQKEQLETQAEALKQALSAAQAANSAKKEFLNSISHEIRTPLNAVIGLTSIASAHLGDSERVKDCLVKIDQSSDRLLSIINDILDMSRIESGKFDLKEAPMHLFEVVHEVERDIRNDLQAKDLKLWNAISAMTCRRRTSSLSWIASASMMTKSFATRNACARCSSRCFRTRSSLRRKVALSR